MAGGRPLAEQLRGLELEALGAEAEPGPAPGSGSGSGSGYVTGSGPEGRGCSATHRAVVLLRASERRAVATLRRRAVAWHAAASGGKDTG